MNKISAIVIPQGAHLILPLLYFASSLFYFSKPTLPEPLFLPKKIRKSLPHVSHFFPPVLSLFAFLPLSSLYFSPPPISSSFFFFFLFPFSLSPFSKPLTLPFLADPFLLLQDFPSLHFPVPNSSKLALTFFPSSSSFHAAC